MDFLEKIIASKGAAVAAQKKLVPPAVVQAILDGKLEPSRFLETIQPDTCHLIAEVKKASPSAGVLREDFDGAALARAFEKGGASAISVLTEEEFFQGSLGLFDRIRAVVKVPLLRKDFVIDAYQLYESKLHGADAVLLIAAVLSTGILQQFIHLCQRLSLDALVEVHDTDEVQKAVDAGATLIGVNARNLRDFSVQLEMLPVMVNRIPSRCAIVCESGIKNIADAEFVKKIGRRVRALLVGEALMRSRDPQGLVRQFTWALRP